MIARVLAVLGDQAECGADACPWQIVDHRHLEDGKPLSPEMRRYGLQPAGADELGIVGRTKQAARSIGTSQLCVTPRNNVSHQPRNLTPAANAWRSIAPSSSNLTKRVRCDQ